MPAAVLLALAAALCFGLGLVLTQLGLRGITPLGAAAISIPSSTLLFLAVSPFALDAGALTWPALAIFAAVGLLYPATATLLTFEANRRLGPVITGTLGNLAPIFAVAAAVVVLGETLRAMQMAGLIVILAGVMLLTMPREGGPSHWRSWALLLPLAAAAIRGTVQPTVKLGLVLWPSPLAATLVSYLVSAVAVLAMARCRTGRWLAAAPPAARLTFVAVGVSNGLAVLLLYAALAHGPVALVSPLVATYPLATIALGALMPGGIEGGVRLVSGVALTVMGVVLLLVG
jgi:drug/metabolite transporter (DMT)-like permease